MSTSPKSGEFVAFLKLYEMSTEIEVVWNAIRLLAILSHGGQDENGRKEKTFYQEMLGKGREGGLLARRRKKRPGDASLRVKQLLPDSSVQMRIVNGFSVGEPGEERN